MLKRCRRTTRISKCKRYNKDLTRSTSAKSNNWMHKTYFHQTTFPNKEWSIICFQHLYKRWIKIKWKTIKFNTTHLIIYSAWISRNRIRYSCNVRLLITINLKRVEQRRPRCRTCRMMMFIICLAARMAEIQRPRRKWNNIKMMKYRKVRRNNRKFNNKTTIHLHQCNPKSPCRWRACQLKVRAIWATVKMPINRQIH